MAAPYLHPKLQVVDSTIRAAVVDVTALTAEQRRERARRAILEAFAERPMRLIEGEVVEPEPAATGKDNRDAVTVECGEQANGEASEKREG
jgi:hypothetical protein